MAWAHAVVAAKPARDRPVGTPCLSQTMEAPVAFEVVDVSRTTCHAADAALMTSTISWKQRPARLPRLVRPSGTDHGELVWRNQTTLQLDVSSWTTQLGARRSRRAPIVPPTTSTAAAIATCCGGTPLGALPSSCSTPILSPARAGLPIRRGPATPTGTLRSRRTTALALGASPRTDNDILWRNVVVWSMDLNGRRTAGMYLTSDDPPSH